MAMSCSRLATVLLILYFSTSAASTSVSSRVCSLPAAPGPCKAYFPSYFYNSTSRTCERFIYGGCGGNGNRFKDFQTCIKSCHRCAVQGAVYSSCYQGPACQRTCDNVHQNLYCRAPCIHGCVCPQPLVLDEKTQRCVRVEHCPKKGPQCPVKGQIYYSGPTRTWFGSRRCAPCRATCSRPYVPCPRICRSGCGCPWGMVIDEAKNQCVPRSSCPAVCVYGGQRYNIGQTWDCSHSSQCKKCRCLPGGSVHRVIVPCPHCKLDNGTKIPVGTTYQPDPCSHCTCLNTGQIVCAVVACAEPPCDNPVTPEGQCCPICPPPGSCTLSNGTVVANNTFYRPDPCTGCTCVNGTPRCFVQDCAAPPCENYYRPPGQCCPVCPPQNTCRYNGQTYNPGDTFNSTDGCNTCTCSEFGGLVSCTERACVRPKRICPGPRPGSHGICVELCSSDDDCGLDERCCSNGCGHVCTKGTLCALVLCAKPVCTFPTGVIVPAGPDECCPSCGCSIGGGKVVRVGESFRSDCNVCSCTSRGPICTLIACSAPTVKPK